MTAPAGTHFSRLKEIFRLAQAQREALRADHFQRFEALLDQRQAIIDDLAAEPGRDPARPENVIPFPAAAPAPEDALAVAALLQGILEIDRENETLLRGKLGDLAASLERLASGRRAARAYRPAAVAVDRYDRAG